MGEKLDSADFCVMTGQLWERGGLSGTASQRQTLAVESLSSAARARVRALGYGFVLHVTLACTAAAGGQVLIRGFHNCGGKSVFIYLFIFCNTSQVSRVVRVSPCGVAKTFPAMNFKSAVLQSLHMI